jgi:hypothetical protein
MNEYRTGIDDLSTAFFPICGKTEEGKSEMKKYFRILLNDLLIS